MIKTIFKYKFANGDDTMQVDGNKVVLVTQQDPDDTYPTVWIEHGENKENFELAVYGTGHAIPPNYEHVGSAVCGTFVWHVYRMEALNVERP